MAYLKSSKYPDRYVLSVVLICPLDFHSFGLGNFCEVLSKKLKQYFLTQKLKESESKQVAIAQLAKEILEKDKDKDQRLSTLGEENLQQSRDISRLQALLKTRDEYLADAESEVTKLRNEIIEINSTKNVYLVELEQKISSLRAEVNDKNGILFDQEQEIQELKKALASKERELEKASQKSEVSVNRIRDSFSDSERAKLNEKVAEMESERNLMLDEISQLQDKVVTESRNLDNERSHVKELSMICNGYRHDVEELKNRCNELTSELNEYRSKTKIAKRGNSMFYEFVDERVKLEKDLLKLKCQNDFFASQKEAYELELNELRHELMLALTLRTNEGIAGSDTSMLQLEISRLRTELTTLNAKLLEKCKENLQVETGTVSNTSEMIDMKEYAFNSLKEEVKILTLKLDRAEKERIEYFDKARESENRYSEECRRSRKLLNEVECLKRRLVLEQKKSFNNALSKVLKPSKEILSEKITDFNEKIASINQIDADDPTISEVQSSFALSSCSLTSARRPLREEEIVNVTSEITMPTESVSDIDQNEAPHLSELKTPSNTNNKEIPVEKRLKFQCVVLMDSVLSEVLAHLQGYMTSLKILNRIPVGTVLVESSTGREIFNVDLPRTQQIVFSPRDRLLATYEPYVSYVAK
uniref:GRIP domain-containing protein n=1 Tax=Elaeophora elaphi TaxID=1147741 RepID=A0A0R3S124_9BILA